MPFTVQGVADIGSPAAEVPALGCVTLGVVALLVLMCSAVAGMAGAVAALACGAYAARQRPSRGYRRVIVSGLIAGSVAAGGSITRMIMGF